MELDAVLRDMDAVDWRQLVHAYGRAEDAPETLRMMVSENESTRGQGWERFWSSLNHQGDYYDSTVAAVPFLIKAAGCAATPSRDRILDYFHERFLGAREYGGDPLVPHPPGGEDLRTPMREDQEFGVDADADDEPDWEHARRMDLCAWQVGRAILSGKDVYLSLLADNQKPVVAAAAALLLIWNDTRDRGKAALGAAIDAERDPAEKAKMLLNYGVYGAEHDLAAFRYWSDASEPMEVRVAAALCWGRCIDPDPLPDEVVALLDEATQPDNDVFGLLPWEGVYHRGLWVLPSNLANILIPLAANANDELRWRAVQGLLPSRSTARFLSSTRTVPVLLDRLEDSKERIRAAAALALASLGEEVFHVDPGAARRVSNALGDESANVCGHAARLLAARAHRFSVENRLSVLQRVRRAERRFRGSGKYVYFTSLGIQADAFLKRQLAAIEHPPSWSVAELLEAFVFPDSEDRRLAPLDCDRMLAEHWTRRPRETMDAAINVLQHSNRTAALGAAEWLVTLGPSAAAARSAMENAKGRFDNYVDERLNAAAQRIQIASATQPDIVDETLVEAMEQLDRWSDARRCGADGAELLLDKLNDDDGRVRYAAAQAVLRTSAFLKDAEVKEIAARLTALLDDASETSVGVAETIVLEGRIFHWRNERRSVSMAAILGLFAMNAPWKGDGVLTAMITQSQRPHFRCGELAVSPRFPRAQWEAASDAAGGRQVSEPRIRAARQACYQSCSSSDDRQDTCWMAVREFDRVIDFLSSRLTPHDESHF